MAICDRCNEETNVWKMSYFNTERLCLACQKKEQAHPDYERAKRIELEACLAGNHNFPGIGKPDDL